VHNRLVDILIILDQGDGVGGDTGMRSDILFDLGGVLGDKGGGELVDLVIEAESLVQRNSFGVAEKLFKPAGVADV
jgi:hypothetical protein